MEMLSNKFYTSKNLLEELFPNTFTPNNCIFKEIFYYNVYNKIPSMKIHYNDIVLDIGAHIGIFSRYASISGASKVIAFEMNNFLFECLRKNLRNKDDAFNCLISDKCFVEFKLEDQSIVSGFDLNHFFYGGLFNHVNFLKIDVMGKEESIIYNISKNLYDVIDKISIKYYNINESNKQLLINYITSNGFCNFHNLVIKNQSIQFLYFWK